MERCLAHRLKVLAGEGASQSTKRYGRVEGAERRRSDFGNGLARGFRQNGNGIHIAELALIGRHASGRVALGKLDVAVTFLHGQRQILGSRVVLVVDKGLACRLLHPPQR